MRDFRPKERSVSHKTLPRVSVTLSEIAGRRWPVKLIVPRLSVK